MSRTEETASYGTSKGASSSKAEPVKSNLLDEGRVSGEPLLFQILELDFTPGPQDPYEGQERCFQFWETLQSCPELDQYRVKPQPEESRTKDSLYNSKQQTTKSSKKRKEPPPFPALGVLTKLETRVPGALRAAFETDKVKPNCEDLTKISF